MTAEPIALLFDLDQTLHDEPLFVRHRLAVCAEAMARRHAPGREAEAVVHVLCEHDRGRRGDNLDDLASILGLKETSVAVRDSLSLYRGLQDDRSVFPGVPTLLSWLRRSARLGLVTNGQPEAQQLKVGALGLREHFDVVITAAERGPSYAKPHPWGVLSALSALSVPGCRACLVGDDPVDVRAASAAGVHPVWISGGRSWSDGRCSPRWIHPTFASFCAAFSDAIEPVLREGGR
jgi:HAD superfamily hydrolase (TIGR01549 family)